MIQLKLMSSPQQTDVPLDLFGSDFYTQATGPLDLTSLDGSLRQMERNSSGGASTDPEGMFGSSVRHHPYYRTNSTVTVRRTSPVKQFSRSRSSASQDSGLGTHGYSSHIGSESDSLGARRSAISLFSDSGPGTPNSSGHSHLPSDLDVSFLEESVALPE